MPGPLSGIRIVEFAGIGPGPFCGMMLADHGAEVIRIDRASGSRGGSQPVTSKDVLARGRKSIAINLKTAEGVALARKLAASADGIIEGFRWCLLGEAPGLSPLSLAATLGMIAVMLYSGYRYFRRTERTFADVI